MNSQPSDDDAEVIDMASERAARTQRDRCRMQVDDWPCRNYAVQDGLCRVHAIELLPKPAPMAEPMDPITRPSGGIDILEGLRDVLGEQWLDQIKDIASFMRRRLTGDYEVDDFGFDIDLTRNVLLPLLRPLHRVYWRVSSSGAEHLPEGGGLIVSNHAGTLPADGLMVALDVFDEVGRHPRALGADLVFKLPAVGQLARKGGATLASAGDAQHLLGRGELVAVWPEGYKGIGKPYRDRYRLQRFGRGGFVATALRAQVPIIPTAIVGSEEIYPLLWDAKAVARVLGVPYFPIVAQMLSLPLLGPVGLLPLPSKWAIHYGEPIDTSMYGPEAADDPMVVFDLAEQVRGQIQQQLYSMLMGRRSVFF
jgi:1-acyl-sn-glycerol-3-phosphate acyltransferase